MAENQKKQNEESGWEDFKKRFKNDPTHRAVTITAVVLILALSVLIAMTAVANRAKQNALPNGTTEVPPVDTTAPSTPPESDEPVDALPSRFMLPVSGKLGAEHDESAQVFSNTMQDYRVHLGIDIMTTENAPVYAAADGKVEKIWEDVRYGTCVAIQHSGGARTIYKNLAVEIAEGIQEGKAVAAGTLIGAVGDTAMVEIAEEPHLHFEMTVEGLSVDPLDYFDAAALATLAVDQSYEDGK